MSEIKMEIKEMTNDICEMYECLAKKMKCEFDKGFEHVDTDEAYKIADIIKDLACAKKDIIKAKYYETVVEAMDAHQGVEDERFYSTPRYRNGGGMYERYYDDEMSNYYKMPMDMYKNHDAKELRDMDRKSKNVMYYTETGNNPSGTNGMNGTNSGGRYYDARRYYTDTKAMHPHDSSDDNSANMNAIGKIVNIVTDDMKELIPSMTPSEKTFLKQKLMNMTNEIK